MATTHAFYIDDSGTKEYAADPSEYNDRRGNSRHFLFCGVLASLSEASKLSNRIVETKERFFGTADVEIKSNWLRIPHECRRRYLDPFDLSEDALLRFVNGYYEAICSANIKLIAVVIDKAAMQEQYKRPFYPAAVSYDALLCRVQADLANNEEVAVIIDIASGRTAKGNQYQDLLKIQHQRLKKRGSDLWKPYSFPSLGSQRFVDSAKSHLVQVADVCAYNVYRQFIDHGDDWERPGPNGKLPMYEHFERIHRRFRCGPKGKVQGYGLVKLPEGRKMGWSISQK